MSDEKDHQDHSLAKAIKALHAWLVLHAGGVTLNDLMAMENRISCLIKKSCETKAKPRLIVFATGHDEPMKGIQKMQVTLKKPIAPGFRRAFTVGFDEDVDVQVDGSFVRSESIEGDSTAPTISASTARTAAGFINGDGAIGKKRALLTADGHVGDGDVPITLEIDYEVAHADATTFTAFTEGADEAIPT